MSGSTSFNTYTHTPCTEKLKLQTIPTMTRLYTVSLAILKCVTKNSTLIPIHMYVLLASVPKILKIQFHVVHNYTVYIL